MGPTGQNAAINSTLVWSETLQKFANTTSFQAVKMEKGPIGPPGAGFTLVTGNSGVTGTTTGWYLLSYKVDVRSGFVGASPTRAGTLLATNPGPTYNPATVVIMPGSSTLVEAPHTNHIYTLSNTVLVNYIAGTTISLQCWSEESDAQIGDPPQLTGLLNGAAVSETVASMVITRIT